MAGLTSAATSLATGGLACIVGVGAVVLAFPDLAAYDGGLPAAPLGTSGAHAGSRVAPSAKLGAMTRRAWLAFAAMSLIWGVPYLFIKIAVRGGVTPPALAWGGA